MDKLKELVAELNEIGDALWSTNALRGRQVKGVARRLEQALATLEQPGNDPEYLTALESGLDNETQEQFIERTGIVQQPSVRLVTGNAPEEIEVCGNCGSILDGNYCVHCKARVKPHLIPNMRKEVSGTQTDLPTNSAAEQPQASERVDELESKCLAQARICNLENERLTMSGQEERARYWEGRSDAFQDCIAFVRALAQPPQQGGVK